MEAECMVVGGKNKLSPAAKSQLESLATTALALDLNECSDTR